MENTDNIEVGTIVKFAEILEEGDAEERMEVLEDRGDRLLVWSTVFCTDWAIRPTTVVAKEDVVIA